ncbi:MAG: acyltransferase [Gordonia sp. (in: high G+C Gram-positive bacteria)]
MTTTAVAHTGNRGAAVEISRARAPRKAYLHNVDLIRATTFSLVIFIHCLTQTTDEISSVPVNATGLLIHVTRNTFFALTGFVLMYQNFDKADFSAPAFWFRRIKLVLFPYLIWSFLYWAIKDMWGNGHLADIPDSLDVFAKLVVWGTSGFHMYFLFVMVQVYLLFPLVVWLLRATVGHHVAVLTVSFALQVAATLIITHWRPSPEVATYWWHYYATFVPYQFFVLFGAVAAVHRDSVDRWLAGKGRWLFLALIVTAALAVSTFLWRVWGDDQRPIDASAAFQPTLLPFIVVAMTCLYAAATYWARERRPETPRFARAVTFASNRSFGVFLCHVMVLFFILRPQLDGGPAILTIGQPWGTIVVYVATILGAVALMEVLRRLPGSVYITGRPRLPLLPDRVRERFPRRR